jgi:hypothetical protein
MQVWNRPLYNFHLFHNDPYLENLHLSELLQSFSCIFILALFMRVLLRMGNETSGSIKGLSLIQFRSYLLTCKLNSTKTNYKVRRSKEK